MPRDSRDEPITGVELGIALSFVVAIVGAIGFIIGYWRADSTQLLAIAATTSLVGLALGLGLWASAVLGGRDVVQEREDLPSTETERAAFAAQFESGERPVVRRRLLVVLGGSGLLAAAAAALVPLRSLGPRPGRSLQATDWSRGRRLVDEHGRPVRAAQLEVGSALTVYPEGADDHASSQAVLINFGDAPFDDQPGRAGWTVDHCVAYSRVCTHAGCAVGVYEADSHRLMCPCHQSLFDVLDGAKPQFGPASRPLPQLPLATDEAGYLVAQHDFDEPVGPGFWNR